MVEMNQHTVKARDRNTRVQEKVRSKNKENAGHRERPSSARDVRPIDSPSPIHNTLGQVGVITSSSQGECMVLDFYSPWCKDEQIPELKNSKSTDLSVDKGFCFVLFFFYDAVLMGHTICGTSSDTV